MVEQCPTQSVHTEEQSDDICERCGQSGHSDIMCRVRLDHSKRILRPYVRRKSDLPLYLGQSHAFYFDTDPYTLNDNVNTKSI